MTTAADDVTGERGETPRWSRYVAIGDSFTEGLVDADPEQADRYLGWADRLAGHLADRAASAGQELHYANLAVRGRLIADIVGPQLDAALAMGPDLVSIVGGGNDIMRPRVDLDGLAVQVDTAVARIRATGADVLMATPTDPHQAGVFRALRPRQAVYTAHLLTIAQRHGAHIVNLWGMDWIQDWRFWGEDRIHPSGPAHQRLALEALLALGVPLPADTPAHWRDPLPPAPATDWRQAWSEHGHWLREHAGPWATRRLRGESSGDAVAAKRPQLEPVRREL